MTARKLDSHLKTSSKKVADLIKAYPNKIKLYLIHKPSKLRGREGRFPDENRKMLLLTCASAIELSKVGIKDSGELSRL